MKKQNGNKNKNKTTIVQGLLFEEQSLPEELGGKKKIYPLSKMDNEENKNTGNSQGGKSTKNDDLAVDSLDTLALKGLLYEKSAGSELDEEDKNATPEYREYYNGKVVALALEEKNNSRLVAFPSVGKNKEEWYKLGGNSALFYKYYVGPRLGRDPKFRSDTDLRHRFKHGIVSVHWGDKFMEALRKIGYKVKKSDYGLIICDLGRTFTAKEVEEMRSKEKVDQEKIKRMIVPKYNFPDIYGNLNVIARLIPPKVKRMDATYREVFGREMLTIIVKLYEDYFKVTNGRMAMEGSAQILLSHVDEMTALLAVIDENNLLDLPTRTRFGTALIDLKNCIKRRLK